jgi:hypothetical protein
MKKTKLICGIGINDANYVVCRRVGKQRIWCPFYRAWIAMLNRCYNKSYQKHWPTYIGCTVDSKWLTFSLFSAWMQRQDWQGKSLDKDVLIQNNKIYSPLTCIFINPAINTLLNNSKSARGENPLGVSFIKKAKKYVAQCSAKGKDKYLGCYDTPEEAHEAYKAFKYKYIAEIANQQSEPLRTALLNYVIEP